jgi:hypothetical protein
MTGEVGRKDLAGEDASELLTRLASGEPGIQEELDRRAEQDFESRYQVARGPFADNDLPPPWPVPQQTTNRRQIMAEHTLDGFLARYDPDGSRVVFDLRAERDANGDSPLIIIRDEAGRVAVINPMPLGNHLCIDVHPFIGGLDAVAGVFGMTAGRRISLPETGGAHQLRSHGWPAVRLVSVIVGEQEGLDDPDVQAATASELKAALEVIDAIGFGASVDDDSVVRAAARAYLDAITR